MKQEEKEKMLRIRKTKKLLTSIAENLVYLQINMVYWE